MSAFNWFLGFFCLVYPTRAEGGTLNPLHAKDTTPKSTQGELNSKKVVPADQMACGTIQALTNGHTT